VGDIPQAHANSVQIAEEQRACYQLRLKGLSIRAIAEELDMAKSTVERRLTAERESRVAPLADEVRQLELDRLDFYMMRLWERIEVGGKATARDVEVSMKVSERRAKLLGLDAPERQQIEATLESRAPEVLALIEQAEASVAEEEQHLKNAEEYSDE
jgi:hypothetical protein